MSKHTPGPWSVECLGEEYFLNTNHLYGVGSQVGTRRVAKVEGLGDESEANARLIAAAPDLLEACKTMLDCFKFIPVEAVEEYNKVEAARKLLKAALARTANEV